jgi:hypothetical protein
VLIMNSCAGVGAGGDVNGVDGGGVVDGAVSSLLGR